MFEPNFTLRIAKLQRKLAELEFSGVYITNPLNIQYLTGFKGVSDHERESTLLVTKTRALLLVPAMYAAEGKAMAKDGLECVVLAKRGQFLREVGQVVKAGQLALESEHLSFAEYQWLQGGLAAKIELVASRDLVEELRLYKDEAEITRIRMATSLTDQALELLSGKFSYQVSEQQLLTQLHLISDELGADGFGFEPIIANRAHSALPHYHTGRSKLAAGILLVDLGLKYQGYSGDLSRTFYLGQPERRFVKRYEILARAQQSVLKAVKPGVTTRHLYVLVDKALGEELPAFAGKHSLGHGLGLAIHELPQLSPHLDITLQPGMVITIEPGLYYEGWGGLRLEDVVLITSTGCETLSQFPKQLNTIVHN